MPQPAKIQRLAPLAESAPRRLASRQRTQIYACTACGAGFMGYPGQSLDWPEPGMGLPPHCGDPDCAQYLQNLSLMRGWMAERGTYDFVDSKGAHFRLSGHAALERRIIEKRSLIASGDR